MGRGEIALSHNRGKVREAGTDGVTALASTGKRQFHHERHHVLPKRNRDGKEEQRPLGSGKKYKVDSHKGIGVAG